MRIGINTRFLLKDGLEGLGIYTKEISSRLAQMHPEHEWFFFFDRKFDSKYIISSNITPVVVYPSARHPFLWYWWFEHSVPRALKKHKIDFFFSPDSYLSLSTSVPQLLTVHDIAFEYYPKAIPPLVRKYYQYYFPKYCDKAQHLVAISTHTKNDLVEKYKIDEHKISTIPNGVSDIFSPISENDSEYIRLKYTDGCPYFLYVGAVHPRKNVLSLLQSFEQFKTNNPDTPDKLLIVGRKAWGNDELMNYYDQMKFLKDVVWLENIEHRELAKITASSTALVYISFYEGFGLPVLESMACGKTAIVSKNSPMSEIIGDAGLTVNPTDISEISSTMQMLSENSDMREKLNQKSLQYSKNYHWDITARKTGALIKKLIS